LVCVNAKAFARLSKAAICLVGQQITLTFTCVPDPRKPRTGGKRVCVTAQAARRRAAWEACGSAFVPPELRGGGRETKASGELPLMRSRKSRSEDGTFGT
jgi:hypothetical protein